MKKKYNINQHFFVVYARHERQKIHESFTLNSIDNKTLGLHDTIGKAPNNELSDGEISKALLNSLEDIYGDNYVYKYISIINWWTI